MHYYWKPQSTLIHMNHKEYFDKNGYVVYKGLISEHLIDNLIVHLEDFKRRGCYTIASQIITGENRQMI